MGAGTEDRSRARGAGRGPCSAILGRLCWETVSSARNNYKRPGKHMGAGRVGKGLGPLEEGTAWWQRPCQHAGRRGGAQGLEGKHLLR